jgi:hypothetical protein
MKSNLQALNILIVALLIFASRVACKAFSDSNVETLYWPTNSRQIGLRGQWVDLNMFYLDYIIFGGFIRSEALIKYDGKKITVMITYLNWNSPPIVLNGSLQE